MLVGSAPSSTASDGSCCRIACSSSHELRARDRARARRPAIRRTSRRVRSASACRPDRYCASASSAHRRSRNGRSLTSAISSARTCACSPVRRAQSRRSSSASSRSSASRSPRPAPRASPRYPSTRRPATARGPPRAGTARGRAHRARAARRPASTSRSKRPASTSSRPGQPIAVGEGLDRLVTQQAPQTHHAALEVLAPRRRRVVTPHRVGELIGAEHLAVRGRQRL